MRLFTSAFFIALTVALGYYLYQRFPQVQEEVGCYRILASLYDQKGLIMKRANQGEETVCLQQKQIITNALECFNKQPDTKVWTTNLDDLWIDALARTVTRNNRPVGMLVKEHNSRCFYETTLVDMSLVK